MSRSLPEWIGRNDDDPVPPRVRLRVLETFGRRCDPVGGCGRHIYPGDKWTCDHKKAIINGGANRETNLHPLCDWCVKPKDRADTREKADAYRKRLKHAGIKLKAKGRPLIGTIASNIKLSLSGPPRWRDSGRIVGSRR